MLQIARRHLVWFTCLTCDELSAEVPQTNQRSKCKIGNNAFGPSKNCNALQSPVLLVTNTWCPVNAINIKNELVAFVFFYTVPLFLCSTLPLFHCSIVKRFHSFTVLCHSASLFHCSLHRRSLFTLFFCSSFPLFHYSSVPLFHWSSETRLVHCVFTLPFLKQWQVRKRCVKTGSGCYLLTMRRY